MNIIERLKAYRHLRGEVLQLQAQIEELESRITSPRTPKLSKMPKGRGGYSIEDDVIRHTELVGRYREKVAALEAEQLTLEGYIDELEITERMVIRARYMQGLTWDETAMLVNYSYRQTWRIYARAIRKLEDMGYETV